MIMQSRPMSRPYLPRGRRVFSAPISLYSRWFVSSGGLCALYASLVPAGWEKDLVVSVSRGHFESPREVLGQAYPCSSCSGKK